MRDRDPHALGGGDLAGHGVLNGPQRVSGRDEVFPREGQLEAYVRAVAATRAQRCRGAADQQCRAPPGSGAAARRR